MFCLLWIFGEDFKAGKVTGKHSGKKGVFKWHLPQPVKVESEANLDGMRKEIHLGDEVQGYFLPCTYWETLLFLVDLSEAVYFARGEVVRWSDDVDTRKVVIVSLWGTECDFLAYPAQTTCQHQTRQRNF